MYISRSPDATPNTVADTENPPAIPKQEPNPLTETVTRMRRRWWLNIDFRIGRRILKPPMSNKSSFVFYSD